MTVAGSRWCGNRVSLSLLYGYSILCAQRSKCIDSYKISTSQHGVSCPEHSVARKGEGKLYVSFIGSKKSLKEHETVLSLAAGIKAFISRGEIFWYRHFTQDETNPADQGVNGKF